MAPTPAPLWVTDHPAGRHAGVVVFATLRFASGRVGTSFPISGIILVVLVIVYSFFTRNTVVGRHIYAVGGNRPRRGAVRRASSSGSTSSS